jgi:hypothetical protein
MPSDELAGRVKFLEEQHEFVAGQGIATKAALQALIRMLIADGTLDASKFYGAIDDSMLLIENMRGDSRPSGQRLLDHAVHQLRDYLELANEDE